jgi:WD40 repeat protein
MPSLSTADLEKAWRYAVETDFHNILDDADTIKTSILTYDTNKRFIPFAEAVGQTIIHAVSSDENWLALGVGTQIHLYNLKTGLKKVLAGHAGQVESIAFSPGHAHILISFSEEDGGNIDEEQVKILIWDLSQDSALPQLPTKDQAHGIARTTLSDLDERLAHNDPPVSLETKDRQILKDTMDRVLDRTMNRARLPTTAVRIDGRVCTSFGSRVYNNAGSVLIYLPGSRPRSNGDDQWDINLYNIASTSIITLTGHRDAIMWVGFSPDDSLVVSASWDGTFRAWQAATGEQLHVWTTDKQNWAGVISPDGRQFLGSDGDGIIRVWDLDTGELAWSYVGEKNKVWKRRVDWSADGRYIIIGGEGAGKIEVIDNESPVSNGQRQRFQCRKLSWDKTVLIEDMKWLARRILPIRSIRFLPGLGDETLFGSTLYVDVGVEFVSLRRNKRWRIFPFDRTEDDQADWEKLAKGQGGRVIYPSYFALKGTKELAVVYNDGIRFWDFDETALL